MPDIVTPASEKPKAKPDKSQPSSTLKAKGASPKNREKLPALSPAPTSLQGIVTNKQANKQTNKRAHGRTNG